MNILPADINECATNNGGCHHTCINTARSFYCSCDDGFKLVNSYGCSGKFKILLLM